MILWHETPCRSEMIYRSFGRTITVLPASGSTCADICQGTRRHLPEDQNLKINQDFYIHKTTKFRFPRTCCHRFCVAAATVPFCSATDALNVVDQNGGR
jgi:hypothetical protein